MVVKLILACAIALFANFAQANNCETMAEMAKNAANLRNAGVPLEAVEKRLRENVGNLEELELGLIVVRIVYKTNGTGQQLKREVLKKCK